MVLKTVLAILILASFGIQDQSLGRSVNDSLPSAPSSNVNRIFMVLDVGIAPHGPDDRNGWRAYPSFRAGIGVELDKGITIAAYFDYYRYYLWGGYDHQAVGVLSSSRSDLAFYGSICLAHIVVAGVGAYGTSSTYDFRSSGFPTGQVTNGTLKSSSIRFFYIIGGQYPIVLSRNLFLPVGLYVRQSYSDNSPPVFVRLGLAVNL